MTEKLSFQKLQELHDKAYVHNQVTRERAANDMVFAWVTQWDDTILEESQLAYKGEFDILRKAYRQIIGDLRSNQVQIEFEPKASSRDDGAELLDGIYLAVDRENTSQEAYNNSSSESVVCGIGGWELYTEYETTRGGDKSQVIRRRPIYEFNSVAFPDPNAKRLDKSDGKYWSVLEPYSLDGYKALHKELTGEDTDCIPANFAYPENDLGFIWVTTNEVYYVVRFYHKTLVKDKILTMVDPSGQVLRVRESDLSRTIEGEDVVIMDELMDQGYTIEDEKDIKRWQVTRYIASGEGILSEDELVGEYLPVVPMYGERAFIEAEEHYEGIYRLGKDPQRLRNFQMSYLADISARSPREKPMFTPEQIAGHERMYEISGAENNFAYAFQNMKDAMGNPLPMGPVGSLPAPNIPPAMGALMDLTRQAVEDVANPGLPQDIADPDVSGRAVELMQNRLDQQSMIYQENLKHAKRYDALVFASMASQVYDAPRSVTVVQPDGSRKVEQIMQTVLDRETGELVALNDLTNIEFEVFAKIGPTYASQRDKTRETMLEIAQGVQEADPDLYKALIYKSIQLMDGVNIADIQEYIRKQLLLSGFRPPEDEEDEALLAQAAEQQEQPNPEMVYAQAEMLKGEASQMREQRMMQSDAMKAKTEDAKVQINAFEAETDRAKVEIEAEEAGARIDWTRARAENTRMDSMQKMIAPFRARVNDRTGRNPGLSQ